jgi:hypothetical protein
MAGQGSSKHYQQTGIHEPVYNVRVSYPINDNSSKEIRDNILIDFFGYNEADIKTLDEQKKGYFYINDKRTPKEWATGAQVSSWVFNTDRTVRIDMPQKLIDSLAVFRDQRASLEIFKVGMFITNDETRKSVTEDLGNLFSAASEKRIKALDNLMVTITGSQSSRAEIYKALRFLTNESGYKNNPFLMLAIAATTSAKSNTPSFSSAAVNQSAIADAVKAANAGLYGNSAKNSFSTISRLEGARINYWASSLYDGINANYEARNRRWIERFSSMSDDERGSLEVGDVISIANSNQNSIRAPFESEKMLQVEKQRHGEKIDLWQKTDLIGQDHSFTLPADHHQSDYFQSPQDTFDKEGFKVNKQRTGQKRPRVEPNLVPNNYNPYLRANIPADAFGALLYLFLEGQKYNKVNMRMQVVANYLNKKRELENQIEADNFHTVPPPPPVIEKYIRDFRRDGRITADPNQKVKIVGLISELERLLEKSNACYKSRK